MPLPRPGLRFLPFAALVVSILGLRQVLGVSSLSSRLAGLEEFPQPLQVHAIHAAAQDAGPSDFPDEDPTIRTHWALLIAGSNGWGNYRHQSDVCHAFQVLRSGGYKEEHIVVMMFDDIANHPANPFPGQMYNQPGGPDNYLGIKPDYSGEDVNAETFLAVLAGDAQAVHGKGTGKVIASGPNDRVFVFYSDHGAPGILGMPTGPFLYADQLHNTIKQKRDMRAFKEMVLYIEACESGSIFEGILGANLGVYAVTASNSHESSWGTYCPSGAPPEPEPGPTPASLGTCMGDLFSVAWMENAESTNLLSETLQNQFLLVRHRTSNNYTYQQGSHALQFGRLAIQRERAADYEGPQHNGAGGNGSGASPGFPAAAARSVPQRDADLEHLRHAALSAPQASDGARAQAALDAEVSRRQALDASVERAAAHLLQQPHLHALLTRSISLSAHTAATSAMFLRGDLASQTQGQHQQATAGDIASLIVRQRLPFGGRPLEGAPLVDDWDCLRSMVAEWESSCGQLDQYAMKHTRFFANLCNAGLGAESLGAALQTSRCENVEGASQRLEYY